MARFRTSAAIGVHLVLLGALAAWAGYETWQRYADRSLPALRNEPLVIEPRYDNPLVVTDEQLRLVLRKLSPRFRGTQPPVSTVDHALRFWGVEAKFSDAGAMSGEEMRRLLVDHLRFVRVYGPEEKPLLIDDEQGVRYRTLEGQRSSSHVDHTLACLAEVGTPLDYPIRTAEQVTTLRAVLNQSLRDFRLNQGEYEWSALAYALYMHAPGAWVTSEGQQMDFDRIARRIMRQRLPQGVCRGNHRLHALVMLLRVHEHNRILSSECREEVIRFLQDVTRMLIANQDPMGFWDGDWAEDHRESEQQKSKDQDKDDSDNDRLLVTGHVLEWWSLAPKEVLPPREHIIRAGQWTVRAILKLEPQRLIRRYGPLSHAGRALALWRGKWPHEVDLDRR